jgi:transcriptional regulator with XRE-family HTH domain
VGPVRFHGSALRAIREDLGLSQEELAHKAGTTFSTISRLERGVQDEPKLGTVQKIATALGVPVTDLLLIEPEAVA